MRRVAARAGSDPGGGGDCAGRVARNGGVRDRRRLRLLRQAPAAGGDRRGRSGGRAGPARAPRTPSPPAKTYAASNTPANLAFSFSVPDEVHGHGGDRNRVQCARQSECAGGHRQREHEHLVQQAVRAQSLRRIGARERLQPVFVDAGGHRDRDRPHGLDVRRHHAQRRTASTSTTPRTACARCSECSTRRRRRWAWWPSRPCRAPSTERVLGALQLARQQRLRRLRPRRRAATSPTRSTPTTRSGGVPRTPHRACTCTRWTATATPASRPGATLPTARRCARPRRSSRPTGAPNVPDYIVFLTDGEANIGSVYGLNDPTYPPGNADDQQPCHTAINLANTYKAAGVTIYSIGYDLGSNVKCTAGEWPDDRRGPGRVQQEGQADHARDP